MALAFLTRLPGGLHPDDESSLGGAVPWFPAVGLLVGALVGVAHLLLGEGLSPLTASAITVGISALVTGAFHEDGLADTFDGLGGHTVERRLEIMRDSRIGTFGAVALGVVLLLRIVNLAALGPADGFIALVAANGLARAGAVALMVMAPQARGSGLGSAYASRIDRRVVAIVLIGLAVAAAVLGPIGVVWLFGLAVTAVVVAVTARRAFGGITGDVLGCVEQLGEVVVLVIAAEMVADHGWSW